MQRGKMSPFTGEIMYIITEIQLTVLWLQMVFTWKVTKIALKAKMFEITYEFYLIIIYLSMNF